ncbi:hypothetical protein Tco_1393617 [Tanacetum coccineum]
MDKIRLSRAQILWDITKINIRYFMSKDPSISRRNKMFWHTAQDDTLFTSMRCISKNEDTRKADSNTSPKKKHVQATKGTRLKSKAKVTKLDKKKQPAKKTKAKGLEVLSEVALTETEQIKLVTKRSKKDFHVSHASGSGDRVDNLSKVPDEQQQKTSGTDKGTGTILGVPDIPPYESESDKESWGDSEDEDNNDDEGDNDDDGDSNDHDDDKENIDDEEMMYNEEDDEVTRELYDDVNVNLGNKDTDMTITNQGASDQQNVSQESGFEQVEEDSYVTLTLVIYTQKTGDTTQSSSVSSDFTSKLLNLDNPSLADNEIASLMDTTAQHVTVIPEITSSFTTIVPPPPYFLYSLQQEATPTPTPTTFATTTSTNLTVTLPEIPNFASIFKFNQRMKEAVDVAIQLRTNKLREEAQAENQEFLNQVDSTMKTIIKDQVKAQVSKIMPKIEKYVTESLGAEVLVRSTNQPQMAYAVAASLFEFELKEILIDKMEANKLINRSDNRNNLYNALVKSYNSDKGIITSYGDIVLLKRGRDDQDKDEDPSEKKSSSTSKDASHHKSSGKSAHAEEPSHTIEDSGMQQDQEFITGDNDEQPADKEVTKVDWFKKLERPPTPDPDWSKRRQVDFRPPQTWISQAARAEEPPTLFDEFNDTSFDFSAFVLNRLKIPNLTQEILVGPAFNLLKGTCKSIMELEYHLEECSKATNERLDWHNPKNKPRRIIAVTRLKIMKKYDYGHLEEIEVRRDDQQLYTFKESDFKRLRLQDIEDMLLLLVQQKLTNLTNDKRSNLRNKTAYTSHSDPHGIIYVDQFKRKRLMRTDKLHKFSDGTLNDVRTALHDIAAGIRMEYLPMRKWSNLDKKRARVMVQDIDKQLYHRRLMRNLEMFIGGRIYGKDLRLLERTI